MKKNTTRMWVKVFAFNLFLWGITLPPVWAKIPRWQMGLPATTDHWLRTVIHLHSVYSHDACDKKGLKNGVPNQSCLNDLRTALCKNNIDVVFLTEHSDHMSAVEVSDTLNIQQDDTPLYGEEGIFGKIQHCPNGRSIYVFPGAENALMPIAQLRHPEPVNGSIQRAYMDYGPQDAIRLKATGGLLAVPHVEMRTLQELELIQPDVLEVYNTHANLLSMLRDHGVPYAIGHAFKLLAASFSPFMQPDLLFLSFFKTLPEVHKKWANYVLNHRVTSVFGADTHQNVSTIKVWDGERIEGYRRTLRWFSNFVHLEGEITRDGVLHAIKEGQVYSAFEIFGTPVGFNASATYQGQVYQMGQEFKMNRENSEPIHFSATLPTIAQWSAKLKVPTIRIQLLKATQDGWISIAESVNAPFEKEVTEPGVYRIEVGITPRHLEPYIPFSKKRVRREKPWIQANPFYVR